MSKRRQSHAASGGMFVVSK